MVIMFIIKRKHFTIIFITFFSFFLLNCQLQEPKKSHGINFLANRGQILEINKTNKNDVILLMGRAHATSLNNQNKWIYFERTITRGKMHKLGQNVLKNNNVLELEFNKYGVLINKKISGKDDMQKVVYSKMKTDSSLAQQSLINKFLQSVRQKMYGKRKF